MTPDEMLKLAAEAERLAKPDDVLYRRTMLKLAAALRELVAECSREYLRGREHEQAARADMSPTWERDVVPLRNQLAEAVAEIERLRNQRCGHELAREYSETSSPDWEEPPCREP